MDIPTHLTRICGSNSILIVNKLGIYRLFCPFKASCIEKVDVFQIGEIVTVIAVKMSNDFKLVYVIQNKGYYHHYFMIIGKPTSTQTTFS